MPSESQHPALVPFLPFLVVGILHLAGQLAHLDWLATATKPFIVLSLAAALIWSVRGRTSRAVVVALAALLLAWIGDLALIPEGEGWFLAGLGFFLFAHVAYIMLFLRFLGRGRLRWSAAAYVLWFIALVIVLAPHLGGMLAPVVVYGAVIATMAITATRCTPAVMIGATLFLLSDSLLALNRFLPDAGIRESGFLIMLSYIAAQGLIILGVVRRAPRHPATLAPPAPARAPAGD